MALATFAALRLFVVVPRSASDVVTAVAPGLAATFSVSGSAPAVVSVSPPTPEMEEEEEPAENTELVLLPRSPAVVGLQPASAQYSESDLQAGYIHSEKQEDKN